MMNVHNTMSRGVKLNMPNMERKMIHHNVSFVDKQTEHVLGNDSEENVTRDLD
jgi:hypothetical protein